MLRIKSAEPVGYLKVATQALINSEEGFESSLDVDTYLEDTVKSESGVLRKMQALKDESSRRRDLNRIANQMYPGLLPALIPQVSRMLSFLSEERILEIETNLAKGQPVGDIFNYDSMFGRSIHSANHVMHVILSSPQSFYLGRNINSDLSIDPGNADVFSGLRYSSKFATFVNPNLSDEEIDLYLDGTLELTMEQFAFFKKSPQLLSIVKEGVLDEKQVADLKKMWKCEPSHVSLYEPLSTLYALDGQSFLDDLQDFCDIEKIKKEDQLRLFKEFVAYREIYPQTKEFLRFLVENIDISLYEEHYEDILSTELYERFMDSRSSLGLDSQIFRCIRRDDYVDSFIPTTRKMDIRLTMRLDSEDDIKSSLAMMEAHQYDKILEFESTNSFTVDSQKVEITLKDVTDCKDLQKIRDLISFFKSRGILSPSDFELAVDIDIEDFQYEQWRSLLVAFKSSHKHLDGLGLINSDYKNIGVTDLPDSLGVSRHDFRTYELGHSEVDCSECFMDPMRYFEDGKVTFTFKSIPEKLREIEYRLLFAQNFVEYREENFEYALILATYLHRLKIPQSYWSLDLTHTSKGTITFGGDGNGNLYVEAGPRGSTGYNPNSYGLTGLTSAIQGTTGLNYGE